MNFKKLQNIAFEFTRPFRLVAAKVSFPILSKLGILFLSRYHGSPNRIGELAIQPDLYVKMGILGWGPSTRGILLARKEEIANSCLLNYWRHYIRVISHPILIRLLSPLAALLHYNIALLKLPNGQVVGKNQATIAVQRQWESDGRPPLLTLTSSDYERGWNCLEQLGIPKGAWFVCLHVRDPGFLNEWNDPYHAYRNADVGTYLLAVKTIVAQGGWVIRMGNPKMKPLPPMEHVIDYAHSNFRSDWMDIFCSATCRFFLGSDSGLFVVSFVFGVPCALTNYAPNSERPWSGKDVYIPKLYWSTTEERYLTFEEALAPPLRHCFDGKIFASLGIRLIDNTPEEINDMTVEMLDRLDGTLEQKADDEYLQKRFNKLFTYESYGVSSRIGRDFLQKYERLLPDVGGVKDDSS